MNRLINKPLNKPKPCRYLCVFLVSISLCYTHVIDAAWSFKKILALTTTETIIHTYTIKTPSTLTIEALDGTVTLKPNSQNTLKVTAVKKGVEEELPLTTIDHKSTDSSISISTIEKDPEAALTVDYTMCVPKNITSITIKSRSGSIIVDTMAVPLSLTMKNGTIDVRNAIESTTAHVSEKGSVLIEQQELSATSSIFVDIMCGDANLQLPKQTSANLKASTHQGSLTCDIPVTLEARTTVLTKDSWKRMMREARGTIGTSKETASISIDVNKGDITITGN